MVPSGVTLRGVNPQFQQQKLILQQQQQLVRQQQMLQQQYIQQQLLQNALIQGMNFLLFVIQTPVGKSTTFNVM